MALFPFAITTEDNSCKDRWRSREKERRWKKWVPELLISHANPQAGGLSFEMKLLLWICGAYVNLKAFAWLKAVCRSEQRVQELSFCRLCPSDWAIAEHLSSTDSPFPLLHIHQPFINYSHLLYDDQICHCVPKIAVQNWTLHYK